MKGSTQLLQQCWTMLGRQLIAAIDINKLVNMNHLFHLRILSLKEQLMYRSSFDS